MPKQKKTQSTRVIEDNIKVAILIDGGFYRRRAYAVFGDKSPVDRAEELDQYCRRHLKERINGIDHNHALYRIFYYDCPPSDKTVYDPISKKLIDLSKSDLYSWTNEFLEELKKHRKFAIRLGELTEAGTEYYLPPKQTRAVISGKLLPENIKSSDLRLMIQQKGVDMRIGLDIASMAFKKQVDQIILISGDSDFVPAAKLARREGIDFVLDPLGATIRENLKEHIDGLKVADSAYITDSKKQIKAK